MTSHFFLFCIMTFGKAEWTFFLSGKKAKCAFFPLKLVMLYYNFVEIIENM